MSQTYDLAIIGGGPAGVAAGVYASRKRLKTIFITKDFNGQSSVSDGVENWIGTVKISGADLSKSLKNHLLAYAQDIIDIKEGEGCESIAKDEKNEGVFTIKTDKGTYTAKSVLLTPLSTKVSPTAPPATGRFSKVRMSSSLAAETQHLKARPSFSHTARPSR
jgi:thioredoxin reductase